MRKGAQCVASAHFSHRWCLDAVPLFAILRVPYSTVHTLQRHTSKHDEKRHIATNPPQTCCLSYSPSSHLARQQSRCHPLARRKPSRPHCALAAATHRAPCSIVGGGECAARSAYLAEPWRASSRAAFWRSALQPAAFGGLPYHRQQRAAASGAAAESRRIAGMMCIRKGQPARGAHKQ